LARSMSETGTTKTSSFISMSLILLLCLPLVSPARGHSPLSGKGKIIS
jgi:hypothetical protein